MTKEKTVKSVNTYRITAILFALIVTIQLVGCGGQTTSTESSDNIVSSNEETSSESKEYSTNSNESTVVETEPMEEPTEETEPPVVIPSEEEKDEYGMTEQQRNSFSMLYYLAITAEDIRISKDNRLLLDEIYTSLLNDINPGAIDETTQDHLKNLRDIIKSYINIAIKRERLQYMYNQDKAAAIRSAVPNPLAVLSMTNSFDWKKLVVSTVYTVVDSYNNYKNASDAADQEFLLSGWELDDEEMATIQRNRERAFDYMVDIVQEYKLDGKLTLNEQAIEIFAEICAIESVYQKIRRLESEEKTYKLLGNYWLELADSYYETSQYEKCLSCVDKYNELSTGIYRKDYNLVRILPKIIVAAQETYEDAEYVSKVAGFADAVLDNTSTEEWSVRYFAAQVYLDLYARTDDTQYLVQAYDIALDNVTVLLDEQRALNDTYLADVKEAEVEEQDYRFMTEEEKKVAQKEYKNEQKRLKTYNKALKEARKTELPPLYEPLVLNCELLFALAEKLGIDNSEMAEIEAILQTEKKGVFLTDTINNRYSFSASTDKYSIVLSKSEVIIPIDALTSETKVVAIITDKDKSVTIDDFAITEVERKGDTVDTFCVHMSSKTMKDYKWSAEAKVTIEIVNEGEEPVLFQFKVVEYKDNWLFADKVVFEEE